MTREEREDAIDIIQSILDKYEESECLVNEITIGDEDIKAFKMAIKALEQEPRWISVSERLPEDGKYVLACDMYKEMMIGTIYEDNCGDSNTNYDAEDENGCVMYDVVAWMSLPEAYSEVKE